MGGTFSGVIPFGGFFVLAIACAVAYAAYRRLNVLRIVVPIAVVFHFYMIVANMGEDGSLPIWSITFASIHPASGVSGTADL